VEGSFVFEVEQDQGGFGDGTDAPGQTVTRRSALKVS